MVSADGHVVWVEDTVHMKLVRWAGRRHAGCHSRHQSRKLLEEQLRQSQKMEAIGRLAGGVAHDFNYILTVMMGYAELLLLTTPANDPCRNAISMPLTMHGKRASGLTRQFADGQPQSHRGSEGPGLERTGPQRRRSSPTYHR